VLVGVSIAACHRSLLGAAGEKAGAPGALDAVDALSPEQYLSLGHVGMAFGQTLQPSIEQLLLQQASYTRRVEVFAPSFALLPLLVVGTNRIATMHLRLAKRAAVWLPLRLLPLPIALPRMTEMLQWPAHHTGEPGSIWLRTIIRETAGVC
jgi:LysR family transcriptional regulator, nod-box dependent transcriptional activator